MLRGLQRGRFGSVPVCAQKRWPTPVGIPVWTCVCVCYVLAGVVARLLIQILLRHTKRMYKLSLIQCFSLSLSLSHSCRNLILANTQPWFEPELLPFRTHPEFSVLRNPPRGQRSFSHFPIFSFSHFPQRPLDVHFHGERTAADD